jgi:hypothetical protein
MPAGIIRYTGQRISPPAFCDISPLTHALTNQGQDRCSSNPVKGTRKATMPIMSIQLRARADSRPDRKSMRTCPLRRNV